MTIAPQEIFREKKSYNYTLNLERLGVTWFDIPKAGSSSLKRYLLSSNRGAPKNLGFGVGHANWMYLFPEAVVADWDDYTPQAKKLVVLRDPVKRLKSGYKHIFTQMNAGAKPLSAFMQEDLLPILQSNRSHVSHNHFKPQSWFFPAEILEDPHTLLWTTSMLGKLPAALKKLCECDVVSGIQHQNSSAASLGEIDVSDAEIKAALMPDFAADFAAYEKASASVQATIAAGS